MEDTTTAQQDDLRRQVTKLTEDLQELRGAARRAAGRKWDEVGRKTSDYFESKKEHAAELEDRFIERIQSDPLRSVLIAAGVGLVLGAFWARR